MLGSFWLWEAFFFKWSIQRLSNLWVLDFDVSWSHVGSELYVRLFLVHLIESVDTYNYCIGPNLPLVPNLLLAGSSSIIGSLKPLFLHIFTQNILYQISTVLH